MHAIFFITNYFKRNYTHFSMSIIQIHIIRQPTFLIITYTIVLAFVVYIWGSYISDPLVSAVELIPNLLISINIEKKLLLNIQYNFLVRTI